MLECHIVGSHIRSFRQKDIYKCGKIDQVALRFGLQHIITLGLTNVNIRKRTFYPLIKFTCQINLRQDENHANLIKELTS